MSVFKLGSKISNDLNWRNCLLWEHYSNKPAGYRKWESPGNSYYKTYEKLFPYNSALTAALVARTQKIKHENSEKLQRCHNYDVRKAWVPIDIERKKNKRIEKDRKIKENNFEWKA